MSSDRSKKKKKKGKKSTPFSGKRQEIQHDVLRTIIERASSGPLSVEDQQQLLAAIDTLAFLTQELEKQGTTLDRLRKMLFGPTSEKTKDVLGEGQGEGQGTTDPSKEEKEKKEEDKKEKPKKKRPGHGRNGAKDYPGADHVSVPHESLLPKELCPCCEKGKVYEQNEPAVLVRVMGIGPLSATVYEKQRLRCNLCGEVFTASSPEGIGEKKYDETAAAMIGLLKYGCGLPFNRIEKLGKNLGIPMPASTQWEVVEEAAQALEVIWKELVRQAAQGSLLHNDDTPVKILALHAELQKAKEEGKGSRTGVFTSGIVSFLDGHELVLFFTGNKHAGENLEAVLAQRDGELEPPIQMCDAIFSNTSGDFETLVANCLVHARRNFVDLKNSFPQEVRYVLEELRKVYKNEGDTKKREMTPEERLRYHQEKSQPIMDRLYKWLKRQFEEKLVEPNGTLGKAIQYMDNHWEKLTLFLRAAGAPLDNNIVERALKRAILHRKNSLFYKTSNGAHVGDIWMTLIYTAERVGSNPFEYLVELQRHHEEAKKSPEEWMPWNYRETLSRLQSSP